MSPDRLRAWMNKRPAGADRIQLALETNLGVSTVLLERSREEIEAAQDPSAGCPDVVQEVLDAAQDYADTEGTTSKFLIRWMKGERPLGSQGHKCSPSAEVQAGKAAPITDGEIIRELLGHIAGQQKQINQSLSTITGTYEKAVKMLSDQLEQALARTAPAAALPAEITNEQREEALQRAAALQAFTGKLPELLDLGIAAIAQRFLPPSGEGDTRQ